MTDDFAARAAEHLRTTYKLDPEQLRQMMTMSAAAIRDSLDQADLSVRHSDLVRLSALAHRLKGTLLNLGLVEAAEQARTIEQAARSRETLPFARLLGSLRVELESLLASPA